MKRSLYLLSCLLILSLTSCNDSPPLKERIEGTWALRRIDFGQPIPPENKAEMDQLVRMMTETLRFTFHPDGSLVTENPDLFSGAEGSAILQRGTWKLNEAETQIHTSMENPTGPRTEQDIQVSMKNNQLILKKADNPNRPEVLTTMIFEKK